MLQPLGPRAQLRYCAPRTAPVLEGPNLRRYRMVHQLVHGDRVFVQAHNGDYRLTAYGWVHKGCLTARNPLAGVQSPWALAERLAAFASAPYVPGGTTPLGADCSGLVWGVLRGAPLAAGVELGRWVRDLGDVGREVVREHAEAGDVVLFYNRNTLVRHVGIVVDATSVLHTTLTNGGARVQLWTEFTNVAQVRRVLREVAV